jgi:sigma-B regulation protein RsbU (phosphoserine phosphatase)
VNNLGTALGFETGIEFERTERTLRPGDALILYSDGVSEAFNRRDECYGTERLLADAGGCAGQAATAIATRVLEKVRLFAGDVPQSDDIAILTLKVDANSSMALELHATPEEVMRGVEALQQFAASHNAPDKMIFGLALALEECGSNIVNHALKRDAGRTFQVVLERTDDAIVIELRDDASQFDPTDGAPGRSEAEDDDVTGGWGIELARRQIDEIRYRREGGENVLRLTKRFVSNLGES